MPWLRIASACAALSRIASNPPCTAGCSVFTRPSIISGKPVRSLTSSTVRPASLSALRVPPVETNSMPWPASARANSTTPDLSETEMRARDARRRFSVIICSRLSQRQPRLVLAGAARGADCGKRRSAGLLESPEHAGRGARIAVDDHLHGAARPVAAGEIDAVLERDAIVV